MRNLNRPTVPKKGGKSHSVEKGGKGDPSALEWLFISVRGFGCVEVLSTYGKSA